MDKHDLDIENYDLEDILNLFDCTFNFTVIDLKNAKKKYLKLHPDKCKLPVEYYSFYKKAYETLEHVYKFRRKRFENAHNVAYDPDIVENNVQLLKSLHGMKITKFNQWFNKAFEKVKIDDDDTAGGYGSWMKSSENIHEDNPVSLAEFSKAFEKKKEECKTLVVKNGVSDITHNVGSNLIRNRSVNYASGIFSKLGYEDLKKAHTETVVPVSHQDFLAKPQYDSVDSYIRHRESQDVGPPSLKQAQSLLAKRETESNKMNSNRAFRLMKQDEEINRMNEKWWSNLRQLENR